MFGTIHAFIPGMIAFQIGRRLVERCPVRLAPALFMVLLVSFVIIRPVLGWTSNWAPLIEAAVGTAIVAFLSFGRVGAPGRAFDLGVARFFGRLVRRLHGDVKVPAKSTIHAVLDRHGLVSRLGRKRSHATGTPLSLGAGPNDLWCADYKGEFLLGKEFFKGLPVVAAGKMNIRSGFC